MKTLWSILGVLVIGGALIQLEMDTRREQQNFEKAVQLEMTRGLTEQEAREYWADVRHNQPSIFRY